MKITVIIPAYNAVAWLEAALRSVLRQEGVALEVIVVDDGSTDGSGALLDALAREDVRVRLFHQANAGQGAARNHGLEQATGDYVYFMDADDELGASDALARLAQEMAREQLDLLFFDAKTVIDEGVDVCDSVVRAADYIRTYDYSGVFSGSELLAAFLKHREFCVSPCLMMLRRSFIEKHHLRFPSERIFYEDNIFMTSVLLAAERASHRPWRLYVRKVHADSTVTSKPTLRHLRGYLACYRDADSLIARGGWNWRTRAALSERRVVYKLHVRRLADAWPNLVSELKNTGAAEEYAELQRILVYPLSEKICNAVRCLRDRGLAFTIRRILFGRQG